MGKDGGHGFEDKPRPGGLGQSKGIHGWKDGQPGQNGYGRIDGDNDRPSAMTLFVRSDSCKNKGGETPMHGKKVCPARQRHLVSCGKIIGSHTTPFPLPELKGARQNAQNSRVPA
ncbi:MAG: hypothetical protein ACLRWP_13320 [Bilophila wadsworthia]